MNQETLLNHIFEEIIEEYYNQSISLNLDYNTIFEVFEPNSKALPEMEKAFDEIKNTCKGNKVNVNAAKNLFKSVNKFYKGKLKEFKIVTDKEFFNAYVFPEYSKFLFSKKIFQKGAKPDFDDISGIYIGFGLPLIKKLTARECVAVMLHETGHVLQHTIQASIWLRFLTRLTAVGSGLPNVVKTILIFPKFGVDAIILFLVIFIFGRTLYLHEHMLEYDADKYCVKYGYGEDIITAFQKLREISNKKSSETYISKIKRKLKSFLYLLLHIDPSHPLPEDRICKIIDEMNKQYNNHYKIKSKKVKEILKHIEC